MHEEVTVNRVIARIIDHQTKQIITLEIDQQPDEEDGEEDLKVQSVKMGTKATVSRICSAIVQHHHGCPCRVVKGTVDITVQELEESVAKHAEGGVIGIPEYFPDF